jgi:hypothetical protein
MRASAPQRTCSFSRSSCSALNATAKDPKFCSKALDAASKHCCAAAEADSLACVGDHYLWYCTASFERGKMEGSACRGCGGCAAASRGNPVTAQSPRVGCEFSLRKMERERNKNDVVCLCRARLMATFCRLPRTDKCELKTSACRRKNNVWSRLKSKGDLIDAGEIVFSIQQNCAMCRGELEA